MKKGKYIDINIILAAKSHKKNMPVLKVMTSLPGRVNKNELAIQTLGITKMTA